MALRIRASTVRHEGKTYRYYQLVRALRRNGRPTHQVVAHLGKLSDQEAAAMRLGLGSLKVREGDTAADILVNLRDVAGLDALRYLDLMVVHNLWERWKFRDFFEAHLPQGSAEVAPADLIETLVANRCVAPCSKLRVIEWTPRTALPEILGFHPEHLNNTRVHRILDGLETVEPALMRFLIAHPNRQTKPSAVVYIDLTNTWFEGQGGDLGETARTKDGAIRPHTIQIALGVDGQGLPLHWEVLPGKTGEPTILPRWVESLGHHEELNALPLVFDRGLASQDNLRTLLYAGKRFVTCARKPKVEDWGIGIDFDAITKTPLGERPGREVLAEAGLFASDRNDDLYYFDYGVRLPVGMSPFLAPGLRVVLYFRPSLFVKHRETIARQHARLHEKVAVINKELRAAKKSRSAEKTRKKIEALLSIYELASAYKVRVVPIEIARPGEAEPIASFQVHLDPTGTVTATQERNAGWMVLLAHPDDDRDALDLIAQYHTKEAVEHAFLLMKVFGALRPIRHQTNAKIQTHVSLCVLGMHVNRVLEILLRDAGITDAVDRVYENLESCRLHVLSATTHGVTRFTITKSKPEQLPILDALGLTHLLEQEAADSLQRASRRY